MKNLFDTIKEAANTHVGLRRNNQQDAVEDEEVERLSTEQKQIRIQIESQKDVTTIKKLKKKRRKLLKAIKARIKQVKEKEVDEILQEVGEVQNETRMFKAIKKLKMRKAENNFVHDESGKCVTDK